MRLRVFAAFLAVSAGTAVFSAAPAEAGADLLQTVSFADDDLSVLPQWQDAIARANGELKEMAACDRQSANCGSLKEQVWRAEMAGARTADLSRKLFVLNAFANSLAPYAGSEPPPPGRPWPSIAETIRGQGGAMGAALLKYLSLREAGVPLSALRIAMVQDVLRGGEAVVVLVRADGTDYVLDAASDSVREARRVLSLIPAYSFNETTLWIHFPKRQEAAP